MRTALCVIAVAIGMLAIGRPPVSEAGSLLGDVNGDGQVNSLDASLILQYSAGLIDHLGPGPLPPPGLGTSRNNPVPSGQALVVPEGWEISVTNYIADATDIVLAENPFNDPPDPGTRYTIVRVRLTNVAAPDPANPDASFTFRLVGSLDVGYTTFTNPCGVIPDGFIDQPTDVFRDGTVEANACYQVGDTEGNFVLYSHFFLADDEDTRWFAVD